MNKFLMMLLASAFVIPTVVLAHEVSNLDMGERCTSHTNVSFEEADKDKDGTLDKEEVKLVCKEKFSTMDTDKDGTVTKEELEACARKNHQAKKHGKKHAQ